MRNTTDEEALFECIDCQSRQRDPEGRLCECGDKFKNSSVSPGL